MNYLAPMSRAAVRRGALSASPFVLVDVGASGGIEDCWRVFDPFLKAYGFDPLIKEVERLNQAEPSTDIRYFPYYVGDPGYDALYPASVARDPKLGWSAEVYERTSAVRAQKLMSMSFTQRFNNEDPEIRFTDQHTSLDEFFARTMEPCIDFIKVDTDGHDYEVLLGARQTMADKGVLGLLIECQLHGVSHPHANLFSNIDRLMRDQGFSLFDFEIYRYSRAVLPGRFVYDIPAQTHRGQVVWGDALYLRDVTAPGYDERWGALAATKLLKLACLHELYGMPDCAAELLLRRRDMVRELIDVDQALDLLAKEMDPASAGYADHNARFERAPRSFFPSAGGDGASGVRRLLRSLGGRLCRLAGVG
jgi:hypothetical protein